MAEDQKVKLDADRLRALAVQIGTDVGKTAAEAKIARGFSGMLRLVPVVIERVDKAGKELRLIGSDKKELAIQIILDLVPDRWVPDWALRPVLGWAIERALPALRARLAGFRI